MRVKPLFFVIAVSALAAIPAVRAQTTTVVPSFSKIEASGVVLTQVSSHQFNALEALAVYAGVGTATITDAKGGSKTLTGPTILTVDTIKDANGVGIVNGSFVLRDKLTGATIETRLTAVAGDTSDLAVLAEGALRTPATVARLHPPLFQVRANLDGKAGTDSANKVTMTVGLKGVVF